MQLGSRKGAALLLLREVRYLLLHLFLPVVQCFCIYRGRLFYMAVFAKRFLLFSMLWGFFFFLSTLSAAESKENEPRSIIHQEKLPASTGVSAFLDPMIADGFDFPVGDAEAQGTYVSELDDKTYSGWYVASKFGELYSLGIHTGDDWNGIGGGDTDIGQPVYAIAKGKVISARDYGAPWGIVVLIKHLYLENSRLSSCYSLYAHFSTSEVIEGQLVEKRTRIGTIGKGGGSYPAHLHLEIRKGNMWEYPTTYWPSSNGKTLAWVKQHYEDPSVFIKTHRQLTVPRNESSLLIAVKHQYRMAYIEKGKVLTTYTIALSQEPAGHKQQQGDNRLPEGEYRIIQKSKGPFDIGPYSGFLGTAWLRINYPNNSDAISGFERKIISKKEMEKIINANNEGKEPSKYTGLGGGIGIHGWVNDWIADGAQNLTWGCISMHNDDLNELYPKVAEGTKILIVK